MALSHDGYAFENCRHRVLQSAPVPAPLFVGRFAGVVGVSVIADERKEQPIICLATFDGYDTLQELETALKTVESKQGKLSGTLTVTGQAAQTRVKCTFAALERGRTFYDGTGVHKWTCKDCRLTWLQRAPE